MAQELRFLLVSATFWYYELEAGAYLQGASCISGEGDVALGPASGRRLAGIHLGREFEGTYRLRQRLRLGVDIDKHQRLTVASQAWLQDMTSIEFRDPIFAVPEIGRGGVRRILLAGPPDSTFPGIGRVWGPPKCVFCQNSVSWGTERDFYIKSYQLRPNPVV
jgi:hypothetical protein